MTKRTLAARRRPHTPTVGILVVAAFSLGAATTLPRWGHEGHRVAGHAAATKLPAEMPAFFREAVDQLSYLNYEPDRWRGDSLPELNGGFRYDHYVDFELLPPRALTAAHRFDYLAALRDAEVDAAHNAGLLPYRILELYQRLASGWERWRAATDPHERAWIEQRILNDAGVLGHYVADGANPHHTSVHHNGWAEGYPNPNGYTTERRFHARFESEFVGAQVTADEVIAAMHAEPRRILHARAEVVDYLRRSHALIERLYQLEKLEPFGPETRSPEHERFAIERLAAGAEMLRDLWWSAWLGSTGAGD